MNQKAPTSLDDTISSDEILQLHIHKLSYMHAAAAAWNCIDVLYIIIIPLRFTWVGGQQFGLYDMLFHGCKLLNSFKQFPTIGSICRQK